MEQEAVNELMENFGKINDAFEKDNRLVIEGITGRQLTVLAGISSMNLPATLGEVATRCGGSYQSMKHVVTRLKELGYLSLRRDDEDRRKYLIDVTEKGGELAEQVGRQLRAAGQRFAEHINVEDIKSFAKIVDAHEKCGGWLGGFKL